MRLSLSSYKLSLSLGAALVGMVLGVALLAPVLSNYSPNEMNLAERYVGPSAQHWFGQDENGSDVFSKVAYGARVSLIVALAVVGISAFVGLIVGSIAGYSGGRLDNIIMRIIDMIYAFPGFLLALALVAMLGPSLVNMILAMCLSSWAGFARVVRGEILHLKEREYVQGAVAAGAGTFRIVVLHMWPNLLGIMVVHMTLSMAGAVITESSLSFLGLGASPTTPTWGSLLNSGRQILAEAPHVSIFPGVALVVLVLGFNLLGEGVRGHFGDRRP